MPYHVFRISLTAVVFLVLVPSAHGHTLYVANNGLDSPSCGPKASPCRSISQAVNTNAADGDTIIVGPGRYGDLDFNGTLGNLPGEETGGFGCVLLLARAVRVLSSDGAAATVIDGRFPATDCNVGIVVDGTEFGKPGKGFTVTNTASDSTAIVINASNVAIRGNQLVPSGTGGQGPGKGIEVASTSQAITIENNQLTGFVIAIKALGAGVTIAKNQVSQNNTGIGASSAVAIHGNVITGNAAGIALSGSGSAGVIGNSFYGNINGIDVSASFAAGVITKNNFAGSAQCGLHNGNLYFGGAPGVLAANNYWGVPTGPGPAPADAAGSGAGTCDTFGGTTTVTPFATKPFKVKAPFKP
jgi:hypothetical protein